MGIDVRIGRVLGAWRLESVLGSGGTSTVYAATHLKDGTRAAVKLLDRELSQRPNVLRVLLAEARLVAAIDHPGTVKVLDDGVAEDGCAYLVFELLVGRSLEDLRQAHGGRVPLDEMMPIGDAVMDALRAVHDAGVVHRDLKPHNIYVLEGGGVKLLDFGLAKLRGYTADAAQDVFGTPSFMPPEQALGLTKKVDAQSDVWSLGATLFLALSGQPVHVAKGIDAMLLTAKSARPRSLADAAPELGSKIVAVIDRALSYHKAERWPDMRAMRAAWQEAHPHWLDTLPPPKFDADPSFVDASALAEIAPPRPGSLFDPRELVSDSLQGVPAHPGAIPARSIRTPSMTRDARRRLVMHVAIAIAAVVFLVLTVVSALSVS
ncbi:MAG: serine/threonine protein kinase [Labilithrix sp.]|nr:serine/threonine protein kinase [Labilithrix sp.]